jgi:hypothetical protein
MDRIRFLHIPKTAGTSLFACLRRLYPGEDLFFADDWHADVERYRQLDPCQQERIVVFGGHAPRVTGEPAIDRLPTVTLLRDPVSRVKSFCQHVSEGKSAYLLEAFPPHAFDLDAFLASGNEELENMQTKALVGDVYHRLPDLEPRQIVERAVRVLADDLTAFGLVERLGESLMLFRHRLGWAAWPECGRLNERDRSKPLAFSRAQVRKIRALNALDIAVYQAAARIFRDRVAAVADDLAADVIRFHTRKVSVAARVGLHRVAAKVRRLARRRAA